MHEYRELENDGAKLQIDYKYYKGLSFGGFMENFFGGEMSYHQVSCLFLKSYLITMYRGPSSLFMNTTDYSLSLIRLTTRFIWNWRYAFQFTGEKSKLVATSDDDTLLNGLKYSRLPITRTFS